MSEPEKKARAELVVDATSEILKQCMRLGGEFGCFEVNNDMNSLHLVTLFMHYVGNFRTAVLKNYEYTLQVSDGQLLQIDHAAAAAHATQTKKKG